MLFACTGSLLTLHSFKQIDSHQSELGKLLMQEIGCQSQHILDFDLHLADTQPAASIQKCYCLHTYRCTGMFLKIVHCMITIDQDQIINNKRIM